MGGGREPYFVDALELWEWIEHSQRNLEILVEESQGELPRLVAFAKREALRSLMDFVSAREVSLASVAKRHGLVAENDPD